MKIQIEEYNEHFSDEFDLVTVRFIRNKYLKYFGFTDLTKQYIGNKNNWYHYPSNKKCDIANLLWLDALSGKIKASDFDITSVLEI